MLVVEALFIIQVYLGKLLLLGMLAMSQYVYNVQWGTSRNTVVFPLKFNQFVRVYCTNNCPKKDICSYAMNASFLTLTGFEMRTSSNPTSDEVCAWLAVGI